jgi:predicted nicotinamide N-methyase
MSSISERARRLQRQIAWRRARGAEVTFELEVGTKKITALQQPRGELEGLGTGSIIWDSAIVLLRYFEKNVDRWHPKKILEVGTGNGLFGMVCAILFEDARITLTDQAPLLPLIHQNLNHNLPQLPNLKDISVFEYNWGEENEFTNKHRGQFDLIIASDCVYDKSPVDLLVDSFRILSTSPETKVVVCVEHRNHKSEENFFQYAAQYFGVEKVDTADHNQDYTAEDIDIYILTLKPKNKEKEKEDEERKEKEENEPKEEKGKEREKEKENN